MAGSKTCAGSTSQIQSERMDRDPEHATGNGVQYSGPVWSAFVKASWAYKAKFNGEMEHLRANKASAK